jgi:hypothetical protein
MQRYTLHWLRKGLGLSHDTASLVSPTINQLHVIEIPVTPHYACNHLHSDMAFFCKTSEKKKRGGM